MSNVSKQVQAAKDLAEAITEKNPTMETGACLIPLPDIGATSGRITLKEAETLVDGSKVTSKAVRNGDLEVFPAKELQVFNSIRVAVKRLLGQYAVEVGGMYLCPIAKLDMVISGIEEQKSKFQNELANLGNRYEAILAEHRKSNPEIAHLIQRHRLEWQAFQNPFRFRMNPVLAVSPLFGNSDELAQSAAQSLWEEIAAEARTQHRTSFFGQERVSQKGVKAFRRLRDKLVNLSFLHHGIDSVVDWFDEVFETLPKAGYVENGDFHRLACFISVIADETNLRMMADGKYKIDLVQPEEDVQEDFGDVQTFAQQEIADADVFEDISADFDMELEQPDLAIEAVIRAAQAAAQSVPVNTDWGSF